MNKKLSIALAIAVVLVFVGYFLSQTVFRQLPVAVESKVVGLNYGGSYDMVAYWVLKDIGGTQYRMLSYNGSIPGPLLKIPQGAKVTINFKNDTGMKTLLHSHGVRMDNAFDGSQTSQEEMKPGETFAYKLKFPDVGMYWYHPHVREDYEQELGLYGNFLVVPANDTYWSPVNREVALFLDDILIENGKINLSEKSADRTLMGRFGNVMLVNGETDYSLSVKKDEVVRLYVTNAANVRPFNFAIEGAKMKLVGADGGAYEKESWADSVTLGPSERGIVEVLFEKSGTYPIENQTPGKTYTLGEVVVLDEPVAESYATDFQTLRTNTAAVKSIDSYRQYFDEPIDKQLNMTVDMMGGTMSSMDSHMMSNGQTMGGATTLTTGGIGVEVIPEGGIEWEDEMQMMNEMSNKEMTNWKFVDEASGKANMDIDWKFEVDDVVKIRITNDAQSVHPMQHPVHFHGQQFLVLDRNGIKQTNLVWKDTVLVPAGQYVDILLNVTNPGTWMAHCHIAEHLEAGMMLSFGVE